MQVTGEADTSAGTAGSALINLNNTAADNTLDDDAVFNFGISNPWQLAMAGQPLARAPNHDSYKGENFNLVGNTARFVAIRPNRYYGGSTASPP